MTTEREGGAVSALNGGAGWDKSAGVRNLNSLYPIPSSSSSKLPKSESDDCGKDSKEVVVI